jgi:hypothetical protein
VLGVDVAQPTPPFLQVGFEEEGDLAGPLVALGHRLADDRQPPVGPALPLGLGLAGEFLAEGGIPGDEAHVEEGGGGVEVAGRQGQCLLHRPDGVAELETGVPQGVPDPLGQGGHVGVTSWAAPVEEHDVEVAARRQLGPAVAADGHEGDVVGGAEERREPGVGPVGVGPAEGAAVEGRVGEERVAVGPDGLPGPFVVPTGVAGGRGIRLLRPVTAPEGHQAGHLTGRRSPSRPSGCGRPARWV